MADDSAAAILSRSSEEIWDLDDSTPLDDLWASPLGRFVSAFRTSSSGVRPMHRLALFAARRALPCWQLYCDGTKPLDAVRTAERFLAGGPVGVMLQPFVDRAVPSYRGTPIVEAVVEVLVGLHSRQRGAPAASPVGPPAGFTCLQRRESPRAIIRSSSRIAASMPTR